MKKIKYKVTGEFGDLEHGTIIDAYIIASDDVRPRHLVYHPNNTDEFYGRACLEFCLQEGTLYVSSNHDEFINLSKKEEEFYESFIKKNLSTVAKQKRKKRGN